MIDHLWTFSVLQSITEAFPISSSAHLLLTSRLLGWADVPSSMDAALHVGAFLALLLYFFGDVIRLFQGFLHTLLCQIKTPQAKLFLSLTVSTLPCIITGFLIHHYDMHIHSAYFSAINSILFGYFLYSSSKSDRFKHTVSMGDAFLIGCFQTLAFFPGVSRLGICLTGAFLLHYKTTEAARFSFLMGLASIAGAIVLKKDLLLTLPLSTLVSTTCLSACITLPLIAFFMYWIKRHSVTPFAVYRIFLGIGVCLWLLFHENILF